LGERKKNPPMPVTFSSGMSAGVVGAVGLAGAVDCWVKAKRGEVRADPKATVRSWSILRRGRGIGVSVKLRKSLPH
jgi:hypothetical protein